MSHDYDAAKKNDSIAGKPKKLTNIDKLNKKEDAKFRNQLIFQKMKMEKYKNDFHTKNLNAQEKAALLDSLKNTEQMYETMKAQMEALEELKALEPEKKKIDPKFE